MRETDDDLAEKDEALEKQAEIADGKVEDGWQLGVDPFEPDQFPGLTEEELAEIEAHDDE